MAGLLGLLVLGEQHACGPALAWGVSLAAGALLGIAADIKINYVLFGLGAAWALRRSLPGLARGGRGRPGGSGAQLRLLRDTGGPGPAQPAQPEQCRQLLPGDSSRTAGITHFGLIATVLVVAVAILALRRLPLGAAARPAIRPTVALCAAWLFLWPYQLPWYDAMIICRAGPLPRLAAGLAGAGQAGRRNDRQHAGQPRISSTVNPAAGIADHFAVRMMAPAIMLATAIALVVLCVNGRWKLRDTPVLEPAPVTGTAEDQTLLAAD